MSDTAQPNPDTQDSQNPAGVSDEDVPGTEGTSEALMGFLEIFTGGRVQIAE